MKHLSILAAALTGLLSQTLWAEDFHPLESMELAGGVYEYDNIFIPEGVILSFVGDPLSVTLRATSDFISYGSLLAPGGQLRIEARQIILHSGASIDVSGVTVVLDARDYARPHLPGEGGGEVTVGAGGSLCVQSCGATISTLRGYEIPIVSRGGDVTIRAGQTSITRVLDDGGRITLTSDDTLRFDPSDIQTITADIPPVPEPETWAMLLAGLGLVVYAVRKRNARTGSRGATRYPPDLIANTNIHKRLARKTRHTREGGFPCRCFYWVPAFAGTTN